uniref:Secreted protein n=1 Tax=Trichuris muris TaxID=70415 RepID=A0A5S6Q0D1_TRIMR
MKLLGLIISAILADRTIDWADDKGNADGTRKGPRSPLGINGFGKRRLLLRTDKCCRKKQCTLRKDRQVRKNIQHSNRLGMKAFVKLKIPWFTT